MADSFKTRSKPHPQAKTGIPHRWVLSHLDYDGDDCLIWPFGKIPSGYGSISINGRQRGVHRLICELTHGKAPSPTHQASHECGNTSCCNPRHINWKTVRENNADKIKHGTYVCGEQVNGAKLTEDQVREIRRSSGIKQRDLARKYGVSQYPISCILRGKTWKHVD